MTIRPAAPVVLAPLLFLMACAPAGGGRDPQSAPTPPRGAERQQARPLSADETAAPPREAARPLPREANPDDPLCAPLIIEQDFGFGTHVVMRRLPDASDLEDMRFITGLHQVLLALPQWPATYADLKPIQQVILPEGAEIVVLLPGWPPTHEALDAWNLVGGSLRLIVVVDGPPADRALITEMNHVRPLERVIAQMEHPSRSGFERLQRPLSFRVLIP